LLLFAGFVAAAAATNTITTSSTIRKINTKK
jgi:hypothetical protein